MIAWATEIKIRAERRTGELLREMARGEQRRGRGGDQKSTSSRADVGPKLKDLSITRDQSSDWQKLAAIPEPEFEQRLRAASADPAVLTTAKMLRPVAKPMKEDPFEEERETWAGVSGWLGRVRDLPPLDERYARLAPPARAARDRRPGV